MKFGRERKPGPSQLPLITLIDVVFLLLIFFLVTMQFSEPEGDLSASLESERNSPSGSSDFEPQVVRIVMGRDRTPIYLLGGRELRSLEGLEAVLRALPKDQGVFVKAADNVPWGITAGAQQACKDAGFDLVSYQPGGA